MKTITARLLLVAALPLGGHSRSEAGFTLLAPTGTYAVGTTSWIVTDSSRRESFGGDRRAREIPVFAWYPASSASGPTAPYLRAGLAEVRAFGTLVGNAHAFDSLAEVRTHGHVDAPIAEGATKFPVLLFSHGYTGLVSAYTALLEDLASHGYIVLDIAHPYEAAGVSLSDGTVATLVDSAGHMIAPVSAVIGEWADEDSTMARVTREPDATQRRALLRGYIDRVPQTNAVVARWSADIRAVLNDVSSKSVTSLRGRVLARADLDRIGVLGHSMGGVASGQFCVDDRRCRAGLNLDGIPQSGTMIDAKMPARFMMVYSARAGRLGANDEIYRRAAARYDRVDVAGTLHLDFSDMNFWGGPLASPRAHGPIAPERAAELTRLIVREFFDESLRGVRSPLLAGTRKVAEITVRRP